MSTAPPLGYGLVSDPPQVANRAIGLAVASLGVAMVTAFLKVFALEQTIHGPDCVHRVNGKLNWAAQARADFANFMDGRHWQGHSLLDWLSLILVSGLLLAVLRTRGGSTGKRTRTRRLAVFVSAIAFLVTALSFQYWNGNWTRLCGITL